MNDSHAWDSRRQSRQRRLERAASLGLGRQLAAARIGELLEAVIEVGDRVCLEGNNQKQADFLARSLVKTDPTKLRDLHLVQSVLALPEHIDLIERGKVLVWRKDSAKPCVSFRASGDESTVGFGVIDGDGK